jgi:hypothetical protein
MTRNSHRTLGEINSGLTLLGSVQASKFPEEVELLALASYLVASKIHRLDIEAESVPWVRKLPPDSCTILKLRSGPSQPLAIPRTVMRVFLLQRFVPADSVNNITSPCLPKEFAVDRDTTQHMQSNLAKSVLRPFIRE